MQLVTRATSNSLIIEYQLSAEEIAILMSLKDGGIIEFRRGYPPEVPAIYESLWRAGFLADVENCWHLSIQLGEKGRAFLDGQLGTNDTENSSFDIG